MQSGRTMLGSRITGDSGMVRKLFIALVVLAGLSGCATYYGHDRVGRYYGDDPYYDGGASSYYYGGTTDYYYGGGYGLLGRGYGGWYGGLGYGYPYRYGYGGSAYRFWPYGGHRWPYYYNHYPRVPRPPHRPDPSRPPAVERGTGRNLPPRRRVSPQPQAQQPRVDQAPIRRQSRPPLATPSAPATRPSMPSRGVRAAPASPIQSAPIRR